MRYPDADEKAKSYHVSGFRLPEIGPALVVTFTSLESAKSDNLLPSSHPGRAAGSTRKFNKWAASSRKVAGRLKDQLPDIKTGPRNWGCVNIRQEIALTKTSYFFFLYLSSSKIELSTVVRHSVMWT